MLLLTLGCDAAELLARIRKVSLGALVAGSSEDAVRRRGTGPHARRVTLGIGICGVQVRVRDAVKCRRRLAESQEGVKITAVFCFKLDRKWNSSRCVLSGTGCCDMGEMSVCRMRRSYATAPRGSHFGLWMEVRCRGCHWSLISLLPGSAGGAEVPIDLLFRF